MENLKNVMIFTGSDLKEFLTNFFINLAYFLLILIITVLIFFVTLKDNPGNYVYFFYLFILFITDLFVRRKFLVNFQLKQNFNFLKFMYEQNSGSPEIPSSSEWKRITGDIKIILKNSGFLCLPLNTLISLNVLTAFKKDKSILQKEFIKKINSISIKLLITGYLLYILILTPFFLISFFFTMGMNIQIKILIYVIALIFASFIKVSVLNPILSLLLQEKAFKKVR